MVLLCRRSLSRGRWGGADIRMEAARRARAGSCVGFGANTILPGSTRCWPAPARSRPASRRRKKDIRRAQKLRYRVFFEEAGAAPDPTARIIRRDVCPFDRVSDHLIVVDKTFAAATAHRRSSASIVSCARTWREREFRLLQRAANSTSRRSSRVTRRNASSRSAAPASRPPTAGQARDRTPVARHSGPMRATTASTRCRLRELAGRRPGRCTPPRSGRSRRPAAIRRGTSRAAERAAALGGARRAGSTARALCARPAAAGQRLFGASARLRPAGGRRRRLSTPPTCSSRCRSRRSSRAICEYFGPDRAGAARGLKQAPAGIPFRAEFVYGRGGRFAARTMRP